MGWFDYYNLLEKYNGDLDKATTEEMRVAVKHNPNDPPTARRIAEEHYKAAHQKANEAPETAPD